MYLPGISEIAKHPDWNYLDNIRHENAECYQPISTNMEIKILIPVENQIKDKHR